MKIVTWNCNGALRKKFAALSHFDADIYVIQECENPAQVSHSEYQNFATNYLWVGENRNKGLGIFCKPEIQLVNNNWATQGLKYFISAKINNSINLVAAWAHGAKSPTFGYIGQFWKYLQFHSDKMQNTIIAGDFNSNVQWDKWDRWWNHSDVIRELSEIDISSVYHAQKKLAQGNEPDPTFFLQRNKKKAYHIDYIFASLKIQKRIKSFEVGSYKKWIALSDHLPLYCEFT